MAKKEKQEQNGEAKSIKLAFSDLNERYEKRTSLFRAECVFATECVGGQPADENGIRQFVIHHLKLTDPLEQEKAVRRILDEELEEVTPPEGEIPEGKVYGVRALRRDDNGVWLGDWMIKACAKVAFSRLGIFGEKRGSKGDVSEVGRVTAYKYSAGNPLLPNQVYVRNSADVGEPHTYFKDFMGRVQTPQGPVSIIHKSECIAAGSRFAFEFRFMRNKLNEDDIQDVLAFMMTIGLGSARSMERGKFRVESAEIEIH
jgi:hypothetical protein